MKTKYNLWSFYLILLCIGITSYSLYSNIQNTWLLAPPNYIILISSITAFIFGIIGYNKTNGLTMTRSWLTLILSLLLSIVLLVVILFTSIFSGYREPIQTTHSPNKSYTINFYRWDAGATGTFGVRGELKGPLWFKKRIFTEARVENVDIEWITSNTMSINNHILNLDKGDTYGY